MIKKILYSLQIMIVLFCLVACNKQEDTSSTDDVSISSYDTLTIMQVDINNVGIREFYKELGNKLHINFNLVEPPENPDSRQAKISTLLASGDSTIDIFTVNDEMISEFKNTNYLEELGTDVVSQEDLKGYPLDYMNSMVMKDKKLYSLPYRMDILSLWVNEQWLQEIGIQDVSTKDNFYKFLKHSWGKNRYAYGGAWEKTYVYNEIGALIGLFGGNYYDWSNEKTKEAVKFMKQLVEIGACSEDQLLDQYEQMNQKFITGEYGMVFMYNGGINSYLEAGVYGKDKIHMSRLPDLGKRATYIATWQYALNNASKNKEVAKKFLRYMASIEGSINFANKTNSIPARIDAINSPSMKIVEIEEVRKYITDVELMARPIPQNSMTYIEKIGRLFQKYITGEFDLDEYCEETQNLIDENIGFNE